MAATRTHKSELMRDTRRMTEGTKGTCVDTVSYFPGTSPPLFCQAYWGLKAELS